MLEATNPATGAHCTADDLTTIDWNDEGTAMLQDANQAHTSSHADAASRVRTVSLVPADPTGRPRARTTPEVARDRVVASGSTLGDSHQLWQTTESTTPVDVTARAGGS